MNKLFDLRYVIGLFFLIIGLLLMSFAFLSESTDYEMDVNLYCGFLFSFFGAFMLLLKKKN